MIRKLLAGFAAVVVASTTATAAHASEVSSNDNDWEVIINENSYSPSDLEGADGKVRTDPQLNPVTIGLCNAGLSNTVVRSYHSTKDGDIDLKCGTSSDGYIHIREEHESQWNDQKKEWPGYWDDLMVQAVKDSVENGHVSVEQKGNNRCYAGTVQIKNPKGQAVNTFHPSTIVSMNNRKVITSIPTTEHICVP